MLTGQEIKLGFMQAGYRTFIEMGKITGFGRQTIWRIINKGQIPTLPQYEKIMEIIGKYIEKDNTELFHNKNPIIELYREEVRKNAFLEIEIGRLREKIKEFEKWDGTERRHSERRRVGGGDQE